MTSIQVKLSQYLRKNKFFAIGLVSIFGILIAGAGVFAMTRGIDPHLSELSFIENSFGKEGSVIPASCNSSPPTSHFSGDCPVDVEVNIADRANTVTTSVTVDSNYGARLVNGVWYVGNNEDTTDSSRAATIHFSSTGATSCWIYTGVWSERGTSWTRNINIGPGETLSYAIKCTDGVFFSGTQVVQVYGEFNRVRPDSD